jgi:hypothetical protein
LMPSIDLQVKLFLFLKVILMQCTCKFWN